MHWMKCEEAMLIDRKFGVISVILKSSSSNLENHD